MMKIKEELLKCAAIKPGDFTTNQKEYVKRLLSQVQSADLVSIEDHRAFLELLNLFRSATIKDLEFLGKNFKKTLESLLSVGEDGVYSNSLRFIYELMQNVDDCNYRNTENCKLDIRFDTGNDLIELSYNEVGFTPENVFAITGIAEGTKNIAADKIEIGEKGIGFKSVFGIADSVLIQSGLFSFELCRGNFIVPILRYENFAEVKGTKLTLRMKPKTVYGIYQEIVKQYSQPIVLLNKNPILFLNKLTDVRFYIDDSMRYLKFHVSRTAPQMIGQMEFEENVLVSVDITDPNKQPLRNSIQCYRYKMPIVFDHEACVSRYSGETEFMSKSHQLVAVFPHVAELQKSGNKGSLYSFLPTQVRLSVPMLMHVPYKLDVSREYVDPQGENLWFCHTNEQLGNFIKLIYSDLATRVKTGIIHYLPKKAEYFFNFDNEKVNCLKKEHFLGTVLLEQQLFFTTDNTFEKAENVLSFRPSENIDDPITMYLLLSPRKKLFLPNGSIDMTAYGVEVVEDAFGKLFVKAIADSASTNDALSVLSQKTDFDFDKAMDTLNAQKLTTRQITLICKHDSILAAFQKSAIERIKKNMRPLFNLDSPLIPIDSDSLSILKGAIIDAELDKDSNGLLEYVELISYHCSSISETASDLFFPCGNTLLLSEDEPINSFASFAEKFVGRAFVAPLRLRQESEKLNTAISDEMMSNAEYFSLLQRVRRSLITILGKKGYNNYIQIINKSGTDNKRFIKELLQNADDCDYSKSHEAPTFTCTFSGTELTTRYNEDGFSKANIRSITAIGESTKKQIQSGSQFESIGEKGVGFKSVFGIASAVAIHSGGFHFKLIDQEPTVPRKAEPTTVLTGTQMIFTLRKPISPSSFTLDDVLHICLCLRKLKRVKIGTVSVEIEETDTARNIFIDGKKYSFSKFEYPFIVTDAEAIEERENKQRRVNPDQTIRFYRPLDKATSRKIKNFSLYSGLPTLICLNIPLVIDAPFEVTTSREGILHGLWNSIVRDEIYSALTAMLHSIKAREKIEIFAYIKEQGIFADEWLNDYPLQEKLSNEALIPLIDDSFVASGQQVCWIYSDFCRYLFANNMADLPSRSIIDSAKYVQILTWLGCKQHDIKNFIDAVCQAVQRGNITDEVFRKRLYTSLKDHAQMIQGDSYCKGLIRCLEIVPVKPKQGTDILFISQNSNIYISNDAVSTDEYFLLAENILSADDFYEIFRTSIVPLDDSQKGKLYKDKIVALLNNSDKYVAKELLDRFNRNRAMFDYCRYELKGRIQQIPFLFCCGEYFTGNKFINDSKTVFFGEVVSKLIVAHEYQEFAEFLECSSILKIHYDDIDVGVSQLTGDDVEDFWHGGFLYKFEIIQGFINDGKIPSELIERYNLHGMDVRDTPEKEFDFPLHPISDLPLIRKQISSAQLNEITIQEETKSRRLPAFSFDKTVYVLREYKCGTDVHTCQMCRGFIPKKYIEVNAIEYEPRYAWVQMHLSLCLNCSKDFELLRINSDIRSDFLLALSNADLVNDEPIGVSIGPREVFFTATHLAEVQEILKRQNAL